MLVKRPDGMWLHCRRKALQVISSSSWSAQRQACWGSRVLQRASCQHCRGSCKLLRLTRSLSRVRGVCLVSTRILAFLILQESDPKFSAVRLWKRLLALSVMPSWHNSCMIGCTNLLVRLSCQNAQALAVLSCFNTYTYTLAEYTCALQPECISDRCHTDAASKSATRHQAHRSSGCKA